MKSWLVALIIRKMQIKTTWDITLYVLGWQVQEKNTINVNQDVEMRELYYIVDRGF